MKKAIRALLDDAKDGGKNAAELFKSAQSAIDTAVKKNLLHKNTAARKKSRLNARLKSLGVNPQGAKSGNAKVAPLAKKPVAKVATKKAPAKKPVAKK